jgi:hypothetical protein
LSRDRVHRFWSRSCFALRAVAADRSQRSRVPYLDAALDCDSPMNAAQFM